jgi:HEAT repeat protein
MKGAKLLLTAGVVALIAYALYNTLQPASSVEGLVQSAKESGSPKRIVKALASHDQKERLKAVQALFVVQTDEAIKLLEKATEDKSTVVRVAIVLNVSDLPERKALSIILRLLDDREFGIVRDSIAALQKFTGRDYGFRFEASTEEKAAVIAQCKHDINERLKR